MEPFLSVEGHEPVATFHQLRQDDQPAKSGFAGVENFPVLGPIGTAVDMNPAVDQLIRPRLPEVQRRVVQKIQVNLVVFLQGFFRESPGQTRVSPIGVGGEKDAGFQDGSSWKESFGFILRLSEGEHRKDRLPAP